MAPSTKTRQVNSHGGANDVVLYTATVEAPRILPLDAFIPR